MSEGLLKPEEIEDLLRGSGSGAEVDSLWQGDASPFDITSAGANIDEQLAQVKEMHAQLPSLLQSEWASMTHQEVTVEHAGDEMRSGSDTLASISADDHFTFFWQDKASMMEGLIAIPKTLFFTLYNFTLGGVKAFAKTGKLTGIEKSYLERYVNQISGHLSKLWQQQRRIQFSLKDLVETQEDLNNAGWSHDCLSTDYTVSLVDEKSSIKFVIPKELVANLGAAGAVSEHETGQVDLQWQSAVRRAIGTMQLPVQVYLGDLSVRMVDVLQMAVGDTFALKIEDGGHPVIMANHEIFRVSFGTAGEQLAIQVAERVA